MSMLALRAFGVGTSSACAPTNSLYLAAKSSRISSRSESDDSMTAVSYAIALLSSRMREFNRVSAAITPARRANQSCPYLLPINAFPAFDARNCCGNPTDGARSANSFDVKPANTVAFVLTGAVLSVLFTGFVTSSKTRTTDVPGTLAFAYCVFTFVSTATSNKAPLR